MRSVCVYVVDDDEAVRSSLTFLLQSYGLRCRTFPDGAKLLDAFDSLQPGCILLDLCMAQTSGVDVQAALARRGARFPVIAMTGADDAEAERRSMQLGALDLLRKPFDQDRLLAALDRAAEELDAATS